MSRINRRRFLQHSASLCLASGASASGGMCTAYLGFGGGSSGEGIHVYSVRGRSWRRIQTISARRPAFLLLDPQQRFLFAANEIDEHDGLPYGTVESFRIEEAGGRLARVSTIGLSLSATRPRHLVSTQGSLVASAHAGGCYNVLDFDAGGYLCRPRHIFKEVGCGFDAGFQAAAHPHSMFLDKAGHIITTDFGCDRISVFHLHDGRLRRTSSLQTKPGDGPGAILLHPDRSSLYVLNLLSSSIAVYSYSAESYTLGKEVDRRYISCIGKRSTSGSLVLNEKNDGIIACLSNSGESILFFWGKRECAVAARLHPSAVHTLYRCPSTGSLVGLDQVLGKVLLFDHSFGFEQIATAEMPLSLAIRV